MYFLKTISKLFFFILFFSFRFHLAFSKHAKQNVTKFEKVLKSTKIISTKKREFKLHDCLKLHNFKEGKI